ncbi:MAG: very short patch repair endonuclease [Chlorobium sp.]|nr:very short patch repair endonuclease [Chlorobium sp.]
MADIVDSTVRSRMMSGIRGKNTRPEILIRKALHAAGYRYRLHDGKLPGKPDLVLRKYNAVIFIHGCFWHGHDCHLFKWPETREGYWREKIEGNRLNDIKVREKLSNYGWRILEIWECSLKGRTSKPFQDVVDQVVKWLASDSGFLEITGRKEQRKN